MRQPRHCAHHTQPGLLPRAAAGAGVCGWELEVVPGSRAWSEGLSSPGIQQQQQLSVHIRVSTIKYIAAAVTAAEKLLVNGSETLKGDVK